MKMIMMMMITEGPPSLFVIFAFIFPFSRFRLVQRDPSVCHVSSPWRQSLSARAECQHRAADADRMSRARMRRTSLPFWLLDARAGEKLWHDVTRNRSSLIMLLVVIVWRVPSTSFHEQSAWSLSVSGFKKTSWWEGNKGRGAMLLQLPCV